MINAQTCGSGRRKPLRLKRTEGSPSHQKGLSWEKRIFASGNGKCQVFGGFVNKWIWEDRI